LDNKNLNVARWPDRVAPQNVDAERAILGAMMMAEDSKQVVPLVLSKMDAGDFYKESHRLIYKAIETLFNNASPVDLLTITEQLESTSDLEAVGGVPYLDEMIESIPTIQNVEYYVKLVRDEAIRRKIISVSAEIYNNAFDDGVTAQDLMSTSQLKVMDITSKESNDLVSFKSTIKEAFNHINEAYQSKDGITGMATGFSDLDAMIAGLHKAEYIVIGARPSMGKSAIIQRIIEHIAVKNKQPVLLFSPEMHREMVVIRMLGSISDVACQSLRDGTVREMDWRKLAIGAGQLSEAPIVIDDTAGISIGDLRTKAYQAKMQYDIQLIAVDYIQEISDPTLRYGNREQELSNVSKGLKKLARELNIPILVASQLSRRVEGAPDKRPGMSDLRGSGSIEQDADVIMFLYRESYYDKDLADHTTEVIIRKQRNGPTGTIKLMFNMSKLRFENLAKGYMREPFPI